MQREAKLMGCLLLMVGLLGLFGVIAGFSSKPDFNYCSSKTLVCGLQMLTDSLFGELAGKIVGAALYLAVSAVCIVVGYKLLKK